MFLGWENGLVQTLDNRRIQSTGGMLCMYICMFMVISKMSRYRITRQVVTEKIARDGPAFLKYLCVPPRAQVPRVCLCGPCSRFLCIVQEPLFLCWGLYFKFFHYKAFSLRMRRLCWLRLLARPVLGTLFHAFITKLFHCACADCAGWDCWRGLCWRRCQPGRLLPCASGLQRYQASQNVCPSLWIIIFDDKNFP